MDGFVLTPAQEGGFIAFDPRTGTTTQGETVEDATANLREAVSLYSEVFPSKPDALLLVRPPR